MPWTMKSRQVYTPLSALGRNPRPGSDTVFDNSAVRTIDGLNEASIVSRFDPSGSSFGWALGGLKPVVPRRSRGRKVYKAAPHETDSSTK